MRKIRPAAPLTLIIFLALSACAAPAATANTAQVPVASPTETAAATQPKPLPATATATPSQAAPALAPGPLTIVALGDSLTEGQGDDTGAGYPPRLQTAIEALRPGSKVLNFGHSGWAAPDLINGIYGQPSELEQGLAAHPDVALVWIGSNDLWYLYEYGPDPMTAEAEQQDLQAYDAHIDTILQRLTEKNIIVFIALLDDQSKRPVVAAPPNPAEPALPATTADDIARMSRQVQAYNEIIARKAAEYGAVSVDFYHTSIFTDPATLYEDGNHPNIAGYEQITQIWFSALEQRLK